jgi:hypothetical protein
MGTNERRLDMLEKRARDVVTAKAAREAKRVRFAGGFSTRLVALARPDRAVSVNGGSSAQLAKLTGLPKTSLNHPPHGRARSYLDLLRWFEKQAWYSNPSAQDAFERMLANARAALFDALVYEEQ